MEWIYTKDRKPTTYLTGHWDDRNSDQVITEDKDGKIYLTLMESDCDRDTNWFVFKNVNKIED